MKKAIIILVLGAITMGCSGFLDREPIDSIDSNKYFTNEKDLQIFSNYFLEEMLPDFDVLAYGDRHVDYLVNSKFHSFYNGNFSAADQGGWSASKWEQLRNVNYFLDNMHKAKASDDMLNHYEGVGRFWRAWFYYGMVRTFGDVPWYEHEVKPTDREALYKKRDSREFVMDKVLEDLQFASTFCSTGADFTNGSCRINRWTALAFMSRVCLFEGTYRKYHTELNLTGTAEKFLRAAADAAQELMTEGPFSLADSPDSRQTQYRDLFTAKRTDNKEIILGSEYELGLRSHFVTKNYYSLTAVGESWGFTKQFINTYLMLDGTPFTNTPGYDTKQFIDEFAGRDYRLKQTVRYPGYVRTVKGVANTRTAPDVKVSPTGYQPIKWCWDDDTYDNRETDNDLCVLRYGEVLLNYAEAKAELGEMGEAEWNRSIKLLRERAGVTSVIPSQADPYMKAYYKNQTDDRWILEVRRERGIELALEGLRQDDLFRWKLGELLTDPWYGIYIPAKNTSYDLDGDGKKDVAVSDAAGSESGVQYLVLSNTISLTEGTKGNIQYNNTRIWEDRKYLRPIPETARQKNPDLGQNPGWEQ